MFQMFTPFAFVMIGNSPSMHCQSHLQHLQEQAPLAQPNQRVQPTIHVDFLIVHLNHVHGPLHALLQHVQLFPPQRTRHSLARTPPLHSCSSADLPRPSHYAVNVDQLPLQQYVKEADYRRGQSWGHHQHHHYQELIAYTNPYHDQQVSFELLQCGIVLADARAPWIHAVASKDSNKNRYIVVFDCVSCGYGPSPTV